MAALPIFSLTAKVRRPESWAIGAGHTQACQAPNTAFVSIKSQVTHSHNDNRNGLSLSERGPRQPRSQARSMLSPFCSCICCSALGSMIFMFRQNRKWATIATESSQKIHVLSKWIRSKRYGGPWPLQCTQTPRMQSAAPFAHCCPVVRLSIRLSNLSIFLNPPLIPRDTPLEWLGQTTAFCPSRHPGNCKATHNHFINAYNRTSVSRPILQALRDLLDLGRFPTNYP